MNVQKLAGKQMKYLIAFFLIGSSLPIGTFSDVGQNSWACTILAALFFVPLIFVYDAVLRLYPGENLYDIMVHVFGNILGKIFCVIYVLFALHLASMVIYIFSEFVHDVTMPETPKIVISTFLILACVFMVYCGITATGRVTKFLFPLYTLTILLTIVTSFQLMDVSNILPVFNMNLSSLFSNSFTLFSVSFGEVVWFTTVSSCMDKKVNYRNVFFQGVTISFLILLITELRNLMILGPDTIRMVTYPSYEAVSVIAIGEFFTRIEVTVGASLLLAGLIKVTVCCFSCCRGLAKVFNIEQDKYLAAPVVLIMVTLSSIAFHDLIDLRNFLNYYRFLAIPYQILLPLAILITAKVKSKIHKKKPDSFDAAYAEEI